MTCNKIIETQLDERLADLESCLNADCLAFYGGILYGADGVIRDAVEAKQSPRQKLAFILETGGGYIEVAQRIVDVVRKHYATVEFIIPDHAMSAGTVLVMSGDAIYMDYFSVLGPIDPQVSRPGGSWVPALGYLQQFQRLMDKANQQELNTAEMAYLIEKFDPAELYRFEQARELSITLLKHWLATYKFKKWTKTNTNGTPVDESKRIERAKEIAEKLNDTAMWHTHSRGISMEVLKRELNLQIEDFGADPKLNEAVKGYRVLMEDYMQRRGCPGALHMKEWFTPLTG